MKARPDQPRPELAWIDGNEAVARVAYRLNELMAGTTAAGAGAGG